MQMGRATKRPALRCRFPPITPKRAELVGEPRAHLRRLQGAWHSPPGESILSLSMGHLWVFSPLPTLLLTSVETMEGDSGGGVAHAVPTRAPWQWLRCLRNGQLPHWSTHGWNVMGSFHRGAPAVRYRHPEQFGSWEEMGTVVRVRWPQAALP